jgi:hypothetical protein
VAPPSRISFGVYGARTSLTVACGRQRGTFGEARREPNEMRRGEVAQ